MLRDNMVEVYWPTGDCSWRQPQGGPVDLSQPDDVLRRGARSRPGAGRPHIRRRLHLKLREGARRIPWCSRPPTATAPQNTPAGAAANGQGPSNVELAQLLAMY